ncbi:hypothetical protein CDL12_02649 [Handroanthus impetiginosus]|uniref:Knr4/Smi1-like domain-containing protein n=1 Tax=Handroanthus impetiginosus TaxID=429701 RepID=A0A2G9I4C6_9LAMI|nr:hypothetical protein CDL12_02649 [Handroanthus impetiginosus]
MATAILEPLTYPMTLDNPKPLRVCFSYAAYAKNLIHYLSSSNIPVESGLSESEFAAVESCFNFTFPPDLRSILQEGLPVGPGFPNWRSSSKQQLEIITSLPILGICKQVSRNEFWVDSWGDRPDDTESAVRLAKAFLKKSPILVPIYRHFYIPSSPCISGNPVFYVHGGNVKIWSFDIAGFFQNVEFRMSGNNDILGRPKLSNLFAAPPWAAMEARRIEFWTEMAERGENDAARGWLRNGGWKEEDVREMMMMDGCDEINNGDNISDEPLDIKCVEWRVRTLSARLLRSGWSTEDVVESLGFCPDDFDQNSVLDGDSWFDFQHIANCDYKKDNSNSLSF